jgi:cell division protein FtsW
VSIFNKAGLKVDRTALIMMVILTGIGLVMVYSASLEVAKIRFHSSSFFLGKQVLRVLFALVFFFITLNIDYHWFGERYRGLIILSVVLLLVLLVSNNVVAIKGAKRWISLFGLSLQPSDLAKTALLLYMSQKLAKCEKMLEEGGLEPLVSMLLMPGAVVVLILLQPNFSTACIISAVIGVMLFIGGLRMRYVAGMAALLVPAAVILVLKAPYRFARLAAFMDPGAHTASYQATQSLIGLGSGGIFGVGLGDSCQKLFFLPEPYTDFVFSILGEEFGFLGIVTVFFLFGVLLYRGYRIALSAPDKMGFYLASGITVMLGVYLFVHSGVVSVILPTTGIPLPFISYGGSNLFFNMIAMGILLNISGQSRKKMS